MTDLATFKIKLKDLVSSQLDKVSRRFGIASKAADDFEGKANKGIGRTNKKLSALNNLGRLAGARNGMAAFSSSSRFAAAGLNPIIAGIGLATVGAVKLGIALVDSGTKLQSNLQITNQLLGGSAKETKNLTAQATALSKVYGDDYTSTVQAASKLATKFGIDNASAFDLLKKGYASGANIGGDMLKTLEDSADAFKGLGATADQQMAILQQSVSKGIKDAPKLLESFNKNLPNLGGDVGRLLDQNFGEGFANSLKKNIKNGEATAIHALKAISTAVGQTKLGQGAAKGLAAQIFGEDSGNAVELLNNFSSFETNLDKLVSKNDSFNKSKNQQLELEKQLASAQLKSSKAFAKVGDKVKIFGIKMKIAFFNGLNFIGSVFSKVWALGSAFTGLVSRLWSINGVSVALKASWYALSTGLSNTWKVLKFTIGGTFDFITNGINAINNLFDRVMGSSFVQRIKSGFNGIKTAVGGVLNYLTTPLRRIGDALGGIVETLKGIKNFDFSQIKAGLADIRSGLNGTTDKQRKNEGLNSKKIGQEIANSQEKTLTKLNKESNVFNIKENKPQLSNNAKEQLNTGINSITTGGSQVRNLSVNIQSMIDKLEIHSTVAEASEEIQDTLKEMFVKVLQGGETTLNRG